MFSSQNQLLRRWSFEINAPWYTSRLSTAGKKSEALYWTAIYVTSGITEICRWPTLTLNKIETKKVKILWRYMQCIPRIYYVYILSSSLVHHPPRMAFFVCFIGQWELAESRSVDCAVCIHASMYGGKWQASDTHQYVIYVHVHFSFSAHAHWHLHTIMKSMKVCPKKTHKPAWKDSCNFRTWPFWRNILTHDLHNSVMHLTIDWFLKKIVIVQHRTWWKKFARCII